MKKIIANKLKFSLGIIALFFTSYLTAINPSIPLFLLVLVLYLQFLQQKANLKTYNLLNLTFLLVIIYVGGFFMLKKNWPLFYIPFAIIPMLSTILFGDLIISLLLSVACAICLAAITGNLYLGILFLVSGLVASILVFDARRRSVVIRSGIIVGIIQAISLLLIERFKGVDPGAYLILLANGVISSIIVVGILPVFEYLFKSVTNISLLELADFNHPLLQRMLMEAPGTYHHSLIVGNLSDAACQAIGAHALLARIGAYYHDIGKLYKPEYFSENQSIEINKHDTLSPTISKMVIMNHVKDGLELAHKYKLSPSIIDFISQHHGNSLVYYFYRRALENLEEFQEVAQEGFRYPGPKPKSKETAIVLLADSVEGATRTLKEPNPDNIKTMVHKVINNKFIDGQLDECDLTLKEIEKISQVFIRILSGMYHGRIAYPEGNTSSKS